MTDEIKYTRQGVMRRIKADAVLKGTLYLPSNYLQT